MLSLPSKGLLEASKPIKVTPYLKTEVTPLQDKGWWVVLATPGCAGPNDGVMQPGYKVCQVVARGPGCRNAAVEPLLCCKLVHIAHKLDGHLCHNLAIASLLSSIKQKLLQVYFDVT